MRLSLLSFLCLASTTSAFHVATTTTTTTRSSSSSSSSSALAAYPSNERIIQTGGGLAVVPSGDRLLFDPSMEGMLGGTGNLDSRILSGTSYSYRRLDYLSSTEEPPPNTDILPAEAWLEDIGIPTPFAKATKPVTATVLGRVTLIEESAPGDIQHVILKLPTGFHYIEGQSLSVIPPGIDAKTNKPNKPRLYSIASTRYGDSLDGTTVSLCVRRAEYFDPVTNQVDPTKQGVCSNFLCDAPAGLQVQVAGPVGKTMVLPEDPTTDVIMVATGTGIAPFRAFLHRLFMEHTVARHQFQAKAWLILGVPVTGGLLYPQEFAAMQDNAADASQLEISYAISREMKNRNGGKLYVQDVLAEQADKLFERLENGAHIYFCGLKGMMPGILEALEEVATSKGFDWTTKLKSYQANHQWHVEVY